MGIGRIIAYVVAAFLLIFGLLFILGAGGVGGGGFSWVLIGIILAAIAIALIYWAGRQGKAAQQAQNVTLKVDLPGNVSMDTLKCQSCGSPLAPENITMVAGAPVVKCPYCGTTYQLTEEPKW